MSASDPSTDHIFGVNRDGKACRRCTQMQAFCFQHVNQKPELLLEDIAEEEPASVHLRRIPVDLIPQIALFHPNHLALRLLNKQCDVAIRCFHGQGKCAHCGIKYTSIRIDLSQLIEQKKFIPWLSRSFSTLMLSDPVLFSSQLIEFEHLQYSIDPSFFCPVRNVTIQVAIPQEQKSSLQLLTEAIRRLLASPLANRITDVYFASGQLPSLLEFLCCHSSGCLPSLDSLQIKYPFINDSSINALAQSPLLSQLTSLILLGWDDLNTPQVHESCMIALASSPFFQSQKLEFFFSHGPLVPPKSLQIIASSPAFSNLTQLTLKFNPLIGRDASLDFFQSLASSPYMSNIVNLEFSHCKITDEQALLISSSTTLPKLSRIDFSANRISERKTIHSFRRAWPSASFNFGMNPFVRTPEGTDDFEAAAEQNEGAPVCEIYEKVCRALWYETGAMELFVWNACLMIKWKNALAAGSFPARNVLICSTAEDVIACFAQIVSLARQTVVMSVKQTHKEKKERPSLPVTLTESFVKGAAHMILLKKWMTEIN